MGLVIVSPPYPESVFCISRRLVDPLTKRMLVKTLRTQAATLRKTLRRKRKKPRLASTRS